MRVLDFQSKVGDSFWHINFFLFFFRLSKCWLKSSDQEKRHANGTIDASGDDVDEDAECLGECEECTEESAEGSSEEYAEGSTEGSTDGSKEASISGQRACGAAGPTE